MLHTGREILSPEAKQAELFSATNYDPYPVTFIKGNGNFLWDDKGRYYLDVMTGYSSTSLGHCHPRLVEAATDQLNTLTLTSRAYHNDRVGPFLTKLNSITTYPKAILMNSGAEAVETAIKVARRWGTVYKPRREHHHIIVAKGNFHGRTTTIVGFSSDDNSRRGFGPFTDGFKAVPYGDINAMCMAINEYTVAVLLEPIQGEAGIIVPPTGYLANVAELCRQNEALLIMDEVQSGLGRTGMWFAYQHEGIHPDGIILGKTLGGGIVPLSAFLADESVMDPITPGSHGSTFGGNPFACRIGHEVLNIIEDDQLVRRAKTIGDYLQMRLTQLTLLPKVKAVRGRGLWAGIELTVPARPIAIDMLKDGIVTKDTHGTVLRIAPTFYVTMDHIDYLTQILSKHLA